MNVVHSTIFWWKRRFLYEFQGFKLSKNEKKKIDFLKIERWAAPLKNLFLKIRNGEIVGNLFSAKMIHDLLLESHNFLKFAKKR